MPRAKSTSEPTARRARTRARILDAAEEVLAERGFGGASVEDICDRAGFTRGAFYSNFASKDNLVLALVEAQARAVLDRIEAVAKRDDLSVAEVFDGVFAVFTADPARTRRWHLIRGELALYALRDPVLGRSVANQEGEIRRRIGRVVERVAGARGLQLTIPVDDYVRTAMAIHNASVAQHLLEPRKHRPDALERSVLPALTTALLAPSVP
jgi:AcrR family transcriptional regulator